MQRSDLRTPAEHFGPLRCRRSCVPGRTGPADEKPYDSLSPSPWLGRAAMAQRREVCFGYVCPLTSLRSSFYQIAEGLSFGSTDCCLTNLPSVLAMTAPRTFPTNLAKHESPAKRNEMMLLEHRHVHCACLARPMLRRRCGLFMRPCNALTGGCPTYGVTTDSGWDTKSSLGSPSGSTSWLRAWSTPNSAGWL